MKTNKKWFIEINKREWEVLDYWCTACRESKDINCKVCMFKRSCEEIARELELVVDSLTPPRGDKE